MICHVSIRRQPRRGIDVRTARDPLRNTRRSWPWQARVAGLALIGTLALGTPSGMASLLAFLETAVPPAHASAHRASTNSEPTGRMCPLGSGDHDCCADTATDEEEDCGCRLTAPDRLRAARGFGSATLPRPLDVAPAFILAGSVLDHPARPAPLASSPQRPPPKTA